MVSALHSSDTSQRARRPAPSALRRARYRAWQFWRGLRAGVTIVEAREVRGLLTDRQLALFAGMEAADRRHSLDLLHELRRDAIGLGRRLPPELERAALLHDVGKGRLRLWHRVVFVLADAIHAGLARRLEAEHGAGWRRALWRLRHHARLGAALLGAEGLDARTLEFVAGHTSPPPAHDPELAWFIAADDRV